MKTKTKTREREREKKNEYLQDHGSSLVVFFSLVLFHFLLFCFGFFSISSTTLSIYIWIEIDPLDKNRNCISEAMYVCMYVC